MKKLNKNHQSLVLITIALLLALSCQDIIETDTKIRKSKIDNLQSEDLIMPLEIGNSWTYHLRFADSTMFSNHDISTRIISGDTVIQGEVWFKEFPYYYCNKSDGLHAMTVEGWHLGYKDMLYAKYPGNTGEKFIFNTLLCQLITNDTVLSVPAGVFKCYFYRRTISAFSNDSLIVFTNNQFYCPGVGLIQDEYYNFDNFNDMRSIYELVSYELK